MFQVTKHIRRTTVVVLTISLTFPLVSGCSVKIEDNGQLITDEEGFKRFGFPDESEITILKKGTFEAGGSIALTVNANAPRLISISTSVWGEQIEWQDGHTIEMIQTNNPEKWSTTSEDGNGGGIEFTPVDGTIELKVENKSDKTFYFEIYEEK